MARLPELVAVLPTRNRAALLPNAVRSVLSQRGGAVRVLVSDNSTSPGESAAIEALCRSQRDRRLCYVRPPEPLSMAGHWEWALRHAMDRFDADHFTFVSSRWVVRPGGFAKVRAVLAAHPDTILTYDDDAVLDDPGRPIRLARKGLTGRLLRVDAEHLLYLVARAIFPSCLPRMLNCVLPRRVAENVRNRFGDLFSTTAPDHALAYRCLAVIDHHYHLDEAVLVQYGMSLSTGVGMFYRRPNDASADFRNTADPDGLTRLAPVPEVDVNINVVFHEYNRLRQSEPERLPEIDRGRYLQALANEVALVEDEGRRERYVRVLRENGWQGALPERPAAAGPAPAVRVNPFRVRLGALLGRRPPDDDAGLTFHNVQDALWFAGRFPKRPVPDADHVGYLRTGWRLGA